MTTSVNVVVHAPNASHCVSASVSTTSKYATMPPSWLKSSVPPAAALRASEMPTKPSLSGASISVTVGSTSPASPSSAMVMPTPCVSSSGPAVSYTTTHAHSSGFSKTASLKTCSSATAVVTSSSKVTSTLACRSASHASPAKHKSRWRCVTSTRTLSSPAVPFTRNSGICTTPASSRTTISSPTTLMVATPVCAASVLPKPSADHAPRNSCTVPGDVSSSSTARTRNW
mmetsp:Transcript_15932/g.55487  ORF Transcript_15932/g.55487 Transcript_15932/m.55487 type:complete len:229 (-) Transcript_15932:5368-6054(-)